MRIDGAIITKSSVTFAIAVVKMSALKSSNREIIRKKFIPIFGNIPIILAAQDSKGIFTYHGRNDIVKFLANLDPSQIPWKTYTVS